MSRGLPAMSRGLPALGQALRWPRRGLVKLALAASLLPAMAGAAPLAKPDARAVRQVVEAQLAAFAAGDAVRAFGYAAASIQARFGNADNFMRRVQSGYPMVIRPAAVTFFQAQAEPGDMGSVAQTVLLRDRQGRLWQASYALERQSDGGWRIGGCGVVADRGHTSI